MPTRGSSVVLQQSDSDETVMLRPDEAMAGETA